MIDRTALSLRALATHAIRSARGRSGDAPPERAESSFERQLRRMGVFPDRPEPSADRPSPATERVGIAKLRALAEPPPSPAGGTRAPVGPAPARQPIGGGVRDGAPPPAAGGDGPIRLTAAGGYRSVDDYIRAKPWESNPNALFPDPSLPGRWIDPVTGRSGTFPTGYVPGEPIGESSPAGPTDGAPAPEPPPDIIADEMRRLDLDPSDLGEWLRFVASIDAGMRQWVNHALETRGLEPVEERPLDELSPELSAKLQAKREREARQAAIVADLNRPGGPQHGRLVGGPPDGVPVYEPS